MVDGSAKSTHARPPQEYLLKALSRMGNEIEEHPLRRSSRARIMRETFGGSDAGGAWDWRMAYDMMQAAVVMHLVQDNDPDAVSAATRLATQLLTETRRSEQQIRLQQSFRRRCRMRRWPPAPPSASARPCWSHRPEPVRSPRS